MNFQIQISYENHQNSHKTKSAINKQLKKGGKKDTFLILLGMPQTTGQKNLAKRANKWDKQENQRYVTYLSLYRDLFDLSYEDKKRLKTNIQMSQYIQTRSAMQCHSHHQKMLRSFGNIQNIIKGLSHEKQPMIKDCQKPQQIQIKEFQQQSQDLYCNDILKDETPFWQQYLQPFSLSKWENQL